MYPNNNSLMDDNISELYLNDDLSSLSRVTLVIPTYNRNFYLSRCLWYHTQFPFAEIIVADSSSHEKREINKKTIDKLSRQFHTKIRYLEYDYPAEEYGGEIYRKWGDALHHVTTDYSICCTDKEFLIPTTIASSLAFLENHLDYSMADGIYYIMSSKKDIRPWQGNESVTENTPIERLNRLTKSVIGTQYSLHRTKDHIQVFEKLQEYELFDIRFGETIIEILPILKGKLYHSTDCVINIRDVTEMNKQQTIINYLTKNLKKYNAESSFARYKSYANYPFDRRNKLLQKLKESIEETVNINEDIGIYRNIMERRYRRDNDNHISFVHKIYFFCWTFLIPYKIKYLLSHIFGYGDIEKKIKPTNESKKVRYVFNMILNTNQYISTDTPITETSIFQEKIM